MILLDLSRPASFENVTVLREQLLATLNTIRLPESVANDLTTAATEMLNNAVEHSSPAAGEIGVQLVLEGETLELAVTDNGGPFDGFRELDAVPINPLDDGPVEGGMGLFIVCRLFPDNGYQAGSDRRHNRFWVRHALRSRRRRILILEDDTMIRQLVEVFLARDYELVPCATVAEAREAVERHQPDLILSDINLPDASGFDLIRNLSQRPHAAPIPVVMMTAENRSAAGRDAAIAFGVDDFITKPISKRSLLDTLKRVLNRSGREAAQMLRHLSDQLTGALVPGLPERMGGWRCAVRAVTAGYGGGDLVFSLPDQGGPTIVVADVMGHGIDAKIHAHAYAGCFYGLAQGTAGQNGPGALLSALSEAVAAGPIFTSSIITALVARLEDRGRIRIASAGHPYPLLLTAGRLKAIAADGPLAGLLRAPCYPEAVVDLQPGDRLFIGTDGMQIEAQAGTADANPHPALLTALSGSAGLPLSEAADLIHQAVHSTFGPDPGDDATFVLIEAV